MPGQRKTSSQGKGPSSKSAGSQVLLWGSLAWKLVGDMSNIDFLMSVQHAGLRQAFQLGLDYGIWGLALIGAVWWLSISRKWVNPPSWPQTVAAFSLISFLWGLLVAVEVTTGVPRIIKSYGPAEQKLGCKATLDTSRLQKYRKDFDVGVVCGVHDTAVDMLTNTKVSISSNYNITPNELTLVAFYNPEMKKLYEERRFLNTWHLAILVPKKTDMSAIHSLADVKKYGGKILQDGYFE